MYHFVFRLFIANPYKKFIVYALHYNLIFFVAKLFVYFVSSLIYFKGIFLFLLLPSNNISFEIFFWEISWKYLIQFVLICYELLKSIFVEVWLINFSHAHFGKLAFWSKFILFAFEDVFMCAVSHEDYNKIWYIFRTL